MRLITRNTDYAMKALCFIAQNNKKKETIPVHELARNLNIPKPFLRKILQVLNKKGLLKSY
ncbi:MAG: Rrf2 family transcriptional regulator, partial [Nanoarchaeota archaeon]